MTAGAMSYPLQEKVAVDYAENATAAAQILAQKWNELIAAGITANDANPATLENWYLAIWDYNSGLHPNTGSGPWGLGWLNNPANPVYPYNRHPFLHEDFIPGAVAVITYDDASHPGDWPYQEKVFGWMEVPIIDTLTGLYSYSGTMMYSHDGINDQQPAGFELARPGRTGFCDPAKDQCDPSTTDSQGNPSATCSAAGSQCWWHYPVSWCAPITNACHAGTWEYNGDAEPPAASGAYYPEPTCDVDTTAVPAGSTIVDSQDIGLNLQGCDSLTANWENSCCFGFTYSDLDPQPRQGPLPGEGVHPGYRRHRHASRLHHKQRKRLHHSQGHDRPERLHRRVGHAGHLLARTGSQALADQPRRDNRR